MRIQTQNFTYPINFSARKKEVRDADKILRIAKQNYPMISSTYADEMYECLPENKKAQKILSNIKCRIKDMRSYVNSTSDIIKALDSNTRYRTMEPLCIVLDEIKKNKVGNCYESAQLGLSALYSNGYMNSKMASLEYRTQIIYKESDEVMYESFSQLDHVFVLTDMNKGGKKNIVIDPWLSFADSVSGAKERFKKIYTDKELKEKEDAAIQDFKKQFMFTGQIDMNKYIVKSGFYFNLEKHKDVSVGDIRTKEILNLWHPKLKVKT